MFDRVIEAYADPHDFLSSFRYGLNGDLIAYTKFTRSLSMFRSPVVALTLSSLLSSGCAATDLAEYPTNLWPARILDANCARISGNYEDRTEDVWPTAAMRGSNQP